MQLKKTTVEIKTVKPYYTLEEYLELEEKADYKNEYQDGDIVPMTGGTTNHNKIAGNFYARLNLALEDEDYEVYIGDVKLWIPKYRQFTYPDIMVVQGQPVYYGSNTTTIMNPLVIVVVLSKSTRDYDQGDKFLYYRSIAEFKEYILIDQSKYHVMQYVQSAEGKWVLTEYELEDSVLALQWIDFNIPFGQLYKRINFTESVE